MKNKKPLPPVRKTMCATCPFRDGSGTEYLRADLLASALTQGSRICHSTGSNNAFHHRTGKPERICRGARDAQIEFFFRIGFIEAATNAAWEKKLKQIRNPKLVSK